MTLTQSDIEKLRSLTSFDALVDYLRDELDWPIETEDAEEITFDYDPEELGIDSIHAVKIETIKQIRPLAEGQPWGVFYIQFETKRLPVVVLRRILRVLVPTSRRRDPNRPAWRMSDLLFICSQGEQEKRSISFAHFRQTQDGNLPELRTFSWDSKENHFYYIKNLYLESLRWPENEDAIESWQFQWEKAFLAKHHYVIRTAQSLASEMASIASTIRDLVLDIYDFEHAGGPLHKLHHSFKTVLIHDLSVEDFADMYAQTVTYGLFSARATQEGDFAIQDVAEMIPNTNPFLKELLEELTTQEVVDLDELGVGQLVQLLQDVDIEAILRDFGRQKKGEDPVIHFYETFLKEYDVEKKVQRGVFYTPDPVVSFIVRSVDQILRTEFNCPDGLADTGTMEWKGKTVPKVQILDPATGTGTFLKYVIQTVWGTFYKNNKNISAGKRKEKWNKYVAEHLLPRMYGFELMMAPYAVAHMKLGLTLKQTGYDFQAGERLRVYLTNSLQPAHEIPRIDTYSLAHEAKEASSIKIEKPITVVIGNPPYSGHSANKGEWIRKLIKDYQTGGSDQGRLAQSKWLQDDYIKFFRFSERLIQKTGSGIIAFITNHSYLDSPTFRGMRYHLINTFSKIYMLDLHGNTKKKESAPDGSKDENVFDIQQGVAICFMVKKKYIKEETIVFHSELYGLRNNKYEILMNAKVDNLDWEIIFPEPPHYLFIPIEKELLQEYHEGRKISDVLNRNGVPAPGIVTTHDQFAISFTPEEAIEKVETLISTNTEQEARKHFRLCTQDQWNYEQAKMRLTQTNWRKLIKPILYRPFDKRWTIYEPNVAVHRRERVMKHMLDGQNLALITSRLTKGETFRHAQVTRLLVEVICMSPKTSNNGFVFPLYLYPDKGSNRDQDQMFANHQDNYMQACVPNLSKEITYELSDNLGLNFISNGSGDLKVTFGPEDVFHYIYSILYSPNYRQRYTGYLRIDFPYLPFTSNIELFRSLCGLGADLVALHLLEDEYKAASWNQNCGTSPIQHIITTFIEGSNGTTMGSFSKSKCYQDGQVYLDTSLGQSGSYFDGVPEDVWNFHIGGYQVLYKWLYDRRGKKGQPGRTLTPEDIEHYQKIVVSLKETIRLMDEIDQVIDDHGGWPIQ